MPAQQVGDVFASNRADSRLALAVAAHAGITRRWRVHESGPLHVRCPRTPAAELEAALVNTAGGMAGGDRFAVTVAVGEGARLLLTSVAAEKVYRSLGPDTTVDVDIKVADGGALAWLPQETILFDRAQLTRRIEVDLAEDAQLLLAEAIVFGRSGMGESVTEGRLLDRWRVRRNGRLIHAESARIEGPIAEKLSQAAVARNGVAVATVLIAPGDDAAVDTIRSLGENFRGEVAASAWNGLAVIRFCAAAGAALRHDLTLVLAALRHGSLPRLWTN